MNLSDFTKEELELLRKGKVVTKNGVPWRLGEKGVEVALPFWIRAQKSIGRALPVAGAALLGALTIAGAQNLIKKYRQRRSFEQNYNQMLRHAPDLKDYDKAQVEARFRTLHRLNPVLASDPLVAASWVKQTLEYPTVTPAVLEPVVSSAATLAAYQKPVDVTKLTQTIASMIGAGHS